MKKLKDKELCKLVKDAVLEKNPAAFQKLVEHPSHLCGKCGRVSNDPDRLCKPRKLED